MKRTLYEYKILELTISAGTPTVDRLNDLGREGWELVGFTLEPYAKYVFKRSLPSTK